MHSFCDRHLVILYREVADQVCCYKSAAIGNLDSMSRIISGEAGTTIDPTASGIVYAP